MLVFFSHLLLSFFFRSLHRFKLRHSEDHFRGQPAAVPENRTQVRLVVFFVFPSFGCVSTCLLFLHATGSMQLITVCGSYVFLVAAFLLSLLSIPAAVSASGPYPLSTCLCLLACFKAQPHFLTFVSVVLIISPTHYLVSSVTFINSIPRKPCFADVECKSLHQICFSPLGICFSFPPYPASFSPVCFRMLRIKGECEPNPDSCTTF